MNCLPIDPDDLDLSSFDEAAQFFLRQAAVAVAQAEGQISIAVWEAGQALHFAHEKCPHGQWAKFCELIGLRETRARQYRQVYERWPNAKQDRDAILSVGKSVLIELAAPSTPAAAVEKVREKVAANEPVTVAQVGGIIDEAKAQTSAPLYEVNHDIDRTRLAPEKPETSRDAQSVLRRSLAHIEASVKVAKTICEESGELVLWDELAQKLRDLLDDVVNA